MKLLFLDFDGVLNSHDYFRTNRSALQRDQLDEAAGARVQRLCETVGAKIVVSSTWRLNRSLTDLRAVLSRVGVDPALVIGKTPDFMRSEARGLEIQEWLDLNGAGCSGMCIVDDDSDMHHLMPWLVQTTFAHGLTDVTVEAAIRTFQTPPPGRAP